MRIDGLLCGGQVARLERPIRYVGKRYSMIDMFRIVFTSGTFNTACTSHFFMCICTIHTFSHHCTIFSSIPHSLVLSLFLPVRANFFWCSCALWCALQKRSPCCLCILDVFPAFISSFTVFMLWLSFWCTIVSF